MLRKQPLYSSTLFMVQGVPNTWEFSDKFDIVFVINSSLNSRVYWDTLYMNMYVYMNYMFRQYHNVLQNTIHGTCIFCLKRRPSTPVHKLGT